MSVKQEMTYLRQLPFPSPKIFTTGKNRKKGGKYLNDAYTYVKNLHLVDKSQAFVSSREAMTEIHDKKG